MKIKNIQFIEVNDGKLTVFTSALHKSMFLQTQKDGTYHLVNNGNAAVEHLYILVDTEGAGFVLNRSGLTFYECLTLINHYL